MQRKYLPYVDDMDDLMYSNPNHKFYIGFDNQQLMFRLFVRNAVHLDKIVRHFREIDQSSFFTGRREPVYLYAVSPFGYFPTGLLFEVLNFIVTDFELNPMKMSTAQMVLIGPKAKSYIYEYLVPLAKRMAELKIDKDNFEVDNISLDRAEAPSDPSVRIMRPYQEDAVRAIIFKGNGRCLIQSPTGSGKSLIIANLIYTLQQQFYKGETFRTLIYVPNIQLVEQFYTDLLEYGFKPDEVCRFSGSTKAKDKKNLFFQAIGKLLLGVVIIGLLIFLPAGSLLYWQGWLFMGILFVPMFSRRIHICPEPSKCRRTRRLSILAFTESSGIRCIWPPPYYSLQCRWCWLRLSRS